MTLSPDRQVLCFDGVIAKKLDVSRAKDLKEDGLFVVRSSGGYSDSSIELSDLIRDRHATVVVYDYCFSACALFFLIASYQTYVLEGALVAWHYPRSTAEYPLCTSLTAPHDGRPKKLQRGPCRDATFGDQAAYRLTWPAFFKDRTVERSFEAPPDSLYVRRMVRNLYEETGVFHDVMWTLHPRYYPKMFKTKIFYEAYPKSQTEVDEMLGRTGANLGLHMRVIYDP